MIHSILIERRNVFSWKTSHHRSYFQLLVGTTNQKCNDNLSTKKISKKSSKHSKKRELKKSPLHEHDGMCFIVELAAKAWNVNFEIWWTFCIFAGKFLTRICVSGVICQDNGKLCCCWLYFLSFYHIWRIPVWFDGNGFLSLSISLSFSFCVPSIVSFGFVFASLELEHIIIIVASIFVPFYDSWCFLNHMCICYMCANKRIIVWVPLNLFILLRFVVSFFKERRNV